MLLFAFAHGARSHYARRLTSRRVWLLCLPEPFDRAAHGGRVRLVLEPSPPPVCRRCERHKADALLDGKVYTMESFR